MKTKIVTLARDRKTLTNQFKAGETFKVLGFQGTLIRLSRVGDNAKLTTDCEVVGFNLHTELTQTMPKASVSNSYDAPHADASGNSRRIVIASCLAGKHSGEVVMHLTPAEEKEYNNGMAKLAEMYPG